MVSTKNRKDTPAGHSTATAQCLLRKAEGSVLGGEEPGTEDAHAKITRRQMPPHGNVLRASHTCSSPALIHAENRQRRHVADIKRPYNRQHVQRIAEQDECCTDGLRWKTADTVPVNHNARVARRVTDLGVLVSVVA